VLAAVTADRPQPQLAHACGENGVLRFWAFGASVEQGGSLGADRQQFEQVDRAGERPEIVAVAEAIDPERATAMILQPVELLVSDSFVLTCRHRGIRFPIGDVDDPVTLAGEIDFQRLFSNTSNSFRAFVHNNSQPDRDLLLFSILEGLVTTLFDARTALSNTKIVFDEQYFVGLVLSRKRAASTEVGSEQVARATRDATYLIDRTRRALGSIQQAVVVFRQWFDDMKPPGLPDKTAIWLPNTTQPQASEHLVDRIYQVRNDLRRVRNEVHGSMALLGHADTGGELLAVRALLDRTESARGAVIVAGSITVLLAAVALSATVAAIPARGARFDPMARAFGFAGVAVVCATGVGIAAAFLSRRPAPRNSRRWALLAAALLVGGLGALSLAVANVAGVRTASVTVGMLCGIAALLVVAYAGDFGNQPRGNLAVDAVAALLEHAGAFQGSGADLAREIDSLARTRRRRFRRNPEWVSSTVVSAWISDPQTLLEALFDDLALLEQAGCRVASSRAGRGHNLSIKRIGTA
jgi:hypothetical protein